MAAACSDGAAADPWPGRLVGQVPGVLDRHREVGEREGHRLAATDRCAEGGSAPSRSRRSDPGRPGRSRPPAPRSRSGRRRGWPETCENPLPALRRAAPPRRPGSRSKARSCVSLTCQPSFVGAGATTNPGVPSRHDERRISSSSVLAVMVTIEVIGVPELVMNALAPLITQPPVGHGRPRSRGAGRRCRPRLRSNRTPPSARPVSRSGNHCSRCSSLPNR